MNGQIFTMYKFRSMCRGADDARPILEKLNENNGPAFKIKHDPRVTRIGRFLRRSSIDELPQLINVFIGEMSLVGPRPERPVWVQQFRQSIPRYMERHREKAGMTGWAQVNGLRGNTSIWERTKYDLWYTENWSLWLDIKILIRTVLQAMSMRSSAY